MYGGGSVGPAPANHSVALVGGVLMFEAMFALVSGAAGALPVIVRQELARRRRVAMLRAALTRSAS